MTVKEFYAWVVENGLENFNLQVHYEYEYGSGNDDIELEDITITDNSLIIH